MRIQEVIETQKKYCTRAMITAIMIGFFFIMMDYKPICKGLVMGTLFSIINFVLIGEMMPLRLNASRSKSMIWVMGSILLRYGLILIPLILAAKMEQFNFAATVGGVFMVQLMILIDQLLIAFSSNFRKQV